MSDLLGVVLLWFLSTQGGGGGGLWPKPKPPVPPKPGIPPTPPPEKPPAKVPPPAYKALPGSGWSVYSPLNPAVIARAQYWVPNLEMGAWVLETDPERGNAWQVAYRKEQHPGKTGVTVYQRAMPAGDTGTTKRKTTFDKGRRDKVKREQGGGGTTPEWAK